MRRALVTGGSGAIGAAICRRLAMDGNHVYVHANTGADKADKLAKQLVVAGGIAESVVFDVTNAEAVAAAMECVLNAGPIQILINNAGIHDDAVMPAMSRDQWTRVVDTSLNGFFNVTQPLLIPMLRTRWGRIVNVSSVAGLVGNRGQTNYAAAKSGLHGATKALALEVASRGVTVNAVAPGIIASSMSEKAFSQEAIERLVPMKRAGTSEEVAELIGFLVSERAAYISGQVISINGGMI